MRTPVSFFALILCFSASLAFAQATPPSFTAEEINQGFSSHSLLAKPRDTAGEAELAAAESRDGVRLLHASRDSSRLRVLEPAAGETILQAVDRLRATGRYDYVEPDYLMKAYLAPNDPRYLAGDQWALRNQGQNSGRAGADVSAEDAWAIQSSASNVVVAVIDSGMRLTHEDLVGSLWVNSGEAGSKAQNSVDDDANGYIDDVNGINSNLALNTQGNGAPTDLAGHGTAVGSVIAATGNNGLGMAGVAWNAQLMALRFIDSTGFGLVSDEIKCIDYAIAKKAQIINASFGGSAFSQSLYDALKRARDAGIIVVCAAGNNTANNDLTASYPSGYLLDNIVAVASTTRTDDLSSFSDYGAGLIEIAAPGSSILTASAASNNGYQVLSGTSFSTPMVSGALALLRAKFPNDTYRESINRLLRSVDRLPGLSGKTSTGGRLNVAAALRSTVTRPFNDDFATREILAGETITARGAAQGSTREAGEPVHGGTAGNGSLWWSWTAPRGGTVTIDTAGSLYDTLLQVYTGSAVSALTSVASNDDDSGSLTTSKVSFTAVAGTTYQIAVDNKSSTSGGLAVLHLALLSNNDNFDSAQTVTGRSWNVTADNRTATRETGEPKIKGNAGGHSLWYRWVAPVTHRYHLSSFSSTINSMVGIYTGTTLANLAEVNSSTNDGDSNFTQVSAGVTFTATAGTTYYIVIDSEVTTGNPALGSFTLSCVDSDWEFFGNGPLNTLALAPGGSFHSVDSAGYLYSIAPDGSRVWRYPLLGSGTFSAPAVAADGTVYVGDDFPYLYAVTPTGTLKWRTLAPDIIESSPAIGPDGTIYIRPEGDRLYAISPTNGSTKWSVSVGNSASATSTSSPIVGPDGTIYCASAASRLTAISPTGTIKWTFNTDFMHASPSIGPDGTIYIGVYAPTRRLYALRPDGTTKWEFVAGDSISSSAAVGPDGAIYFGCSDKNLYALNSNGTLRWTYQAGDFIKFSSPVIASDGSVYIGSYDGKVHCVEPDGTLRRTFATANQITSSPLLYNGRLYVSSSDYRLYSLQVDQVPASSAWPMARQNLRRSAQIESPALAFGVQPASQTVAVEEKVVFVAGAVGTAPLSYQWFFNGQAITGATASTYRIDTVYHANGGKYSVKVTDSTGTITSNDATLTLSTPLVLPTVLTAPVAQTVLSGTGATLSVTASGSAPFTYQWLKDGTAITGATSSTLTLSDLRPGNAANYSVTITNFGGSVTSTPVAVKINSISRISNLSVLTSIDGPGDNFTLGYVVGGGGTTGSKPLIVRAAGPSLGALGVGGTLDDPKLELYAGSSKTGENDNWGGGADLIAAFTSVGAFPFSNTKDAASLANVASRDYSVKVTAASNNSGAVIAEVYDASPDAAFVTSTPRLLNVSVLKSLGQGLTVGFTIAGSTPKTVVIRAIGPTLGGFGVGGTVVDPQLTLYNGSTKIGENDNWGGGAALSAAFTGVGAFDLPATSKDAALLVTLPPGGYSVEAKGVNNTTGVALVEVYEVP